MMFRERDDNEELLKTIEFFPRLQPNSSHLYVHFDNCLSYECCREERPEWYEEMPTCNAGEVK